MEFVIQKKPLLKLAERANGVADAKSTMPILGCVLVTATGESVSIAATDLYLSVNSSASATVKTEGSVVIPAKDLVERLKMMPEGPIVVTSQANAATTIKAQGSARRYTLRGMPGSDFPLLPQPAEDAPSVTIDALVLADLIRKTAFSISTDDTRAHLNSAQFEWEGEIVRMVTTDGHRLSKAETTIGGRHASLTMLIPIKAVHELRKICDEVVSAPASDDGGKKELVLTQNGPNAFFTFGSTSFTAKLVDAQFPSYSQVIPKSFESTVRAPRIALTDSFKAMAVSSNEVSKCIKLSITNGSMLVESESAKSGDGHDEIDVEYFGHNMSIGLNAKFLLDAIGAVSGDDVELCLSGELDPAVIRPVASSSPDGKDFIAVIMPVRI